MPWHKVTLTTRSVPAEELRTLRDKFNDFWQAAGSPDGVALFSDRVPSPRPDKQTGTKLSFYFSPDSLRCASLLIQVYSGIPCERPDINNVAFLAGDVGCWDLLK